MRRPPGGPRRATAACGVVLACVLTACSGGDDDETSGAGSVAQAFVDAVDGTAGDAVDLGDVAWVGDEPASEATEGYAATVAGLGDVEPTVELGPVDEDGGGETAVATLTWSWPLTAGDDWTYESRLSLSTADGGWAAIWERAAVQPDLTSRDVLEATEITARRGDVLGADGRRLVRPRDVVEVGIDRAAVAERRAGGSARRLAALVGVDPGPYAEQVEAAGELAFVPAITLRLDDLGPSLDDDVDAIPGGRLVGGTLPLAPTAEFAAPILGRVGDVTAEMVEESPDLYAPGDQAGVSGLQLRYDEQLRGVDGVQVESVGRDGEGRGTVLWDVDAERGADLALTLDEDLQLTAEQLLADVGPASAIVALRPSTGDLLVAANGPGNDGQNLATYGQFAPGSTFKVVSSLALLRSGLEPDSFVPCTSAITVDGKEFENYDDYPVDALGDVTLRTAIASSCNTAVISQADRLGRDDLADAAASLGLGVDHDLGFPSYFGSVEPPASETEAAADLIGQGTVLASPMVMAAVIGSVQEGATVVPRLLADADPVAPGVDGPTGAEADALRDLLGAVVSEGSGAGLADVPGPPVIAKTGTAEFDQDGERRLHAWMVAAQGDLAVAVFVAEGRSGSTTAGPILESFLRAAR